MARAMITKFYLFRVCTFFSYLCVSDTISRWFYASYGLSVNYPRVCKTLGVLGITIGPGTSRTAQTSSWKYLLQILFFRVILTRSCLLSKMTFAFQRLNIKTDY
ncbi:hypothetical protein BDZ97DRAFT_1808050 [Flammula alnicola]|nr:hypothetical protein BDZ97DRAFT_1808050 [Flammula alnicola]